MCNLREKVEFPTPSNLYPLKLLKLYLVIISAICGPVLHKCDMRGDDYTFGVQQIP